MRILIVEDDFLVADAVSTLLRDAGHTVVLAADSREALRSLERDAELGLALVDLHLRDGATGPRVAEAAVRRSLPTLICSYDPALRAQVATLLPAAAVIDKLYTAEELLLAVRAMIPAGGGPQAAGH